MYAGIWHYNKHQSCEPRNPAASPRYRKRRKCSVRRRPRTEWLPLDLPEDLRIVPRDRWERVQRQLAQNLAFSPRNEKHAYLLKGLVRCGGCGSRYVGDPCHGRFYYRCIARCKKVPTIRDVALNDAVKKAVERVLIDPGVILEPLRRLDNAAKVERQTQERAAGQIEREATRLEAEEQRVLDAYRTGVISPAQLGRQLEQLKARKSALDLRRAEIQQQAAVPPEQIERAVTDYCAEAARNLASFTDEQWRDLLRTVIQTIVFDGNQVKIQGAIPVDAPVGTEGTGIRIEMSVH
jgi:site-specific DNA recombinase